MPAAGLKSKRLPTSAVPAPVSLPAGASQVGTREHRKSSPASMPAANGDELKRSIAASSERRKSGGSSIMPIDKSARPTVPKADNDDVNQRRKAQRERIEASANPSELSTNGKRLLISSGPSGLQRTHSLPNVSHVQGGNQNRQSGNSQQLGLSKDSLMPAQSLSQSTAPRRMSGRPLPQPQQRNSSEPHKDSKLPLRGQSPDTAATPEIVGDASHSTVPSMKGAHAASTSSIGHVRALSKPAVVAPPSEAGAVSMLANAHSSAVVAKDSAAPSHLPLTTPRNGQPDTSARSTHKNGSSLLSASESITPTRTPPAADQNPETRASTSSRSETTHPVLPGATSKPAVDSGLSPSLVSESTTPTRTQSPADQGPVLTTIAGTSVASVDSEMSHPVLPESISKSAPPSVSQRTTVASVQFTTGQTSVAMSSSSSTETNVGDFSSQQSSAPGSAQPPVSSIVPGGVVPTVSALVLGGTLGSSPGAQPAGSLSIGGSPLLPPVHQTPHTPISAPKKPALSYEKPEGLKMNRVLTIVALAGLGAWAFKLYYLDPRHINTSDGFYHRGEIR
jgi:hypothetical protein